MTESYSSFYLCNQIGNKETNKKYFNQNFDKSRNIYSQSILKVSILRIKRRPPQKVIPDMQSYLKTQATESKHHFRPFKESKYLEKRYNVLRQLGRVGRSLKHRPKFGKLNLRAKVTSLAQNHINDSGPRLPLQIKHNFVNEFSNNLKICTVKPGDDKNTEESQTVVFHNNSFHNIPQSKWKPINHWVNTGNFGKEAFQKEQVFQAKAQFDPINFPENPKHKGHTLLASFHHCFRNADVVMCQLNGMQCPMTIDTGASNSVTTSRTMEKYFGSHFKQLLKPYEGPEFFNVSGNKLDVLGQFEPFLICGQLKWHQMMIVIESDHLEFLGGRDFLKKFKIVITTNELIIPIEILKQNDNQQCNRLAAKNTPLFLLQSAHSMAIEPRQSKQIKVYIDKKDYSEKQMEALTKFGLVAHSEDIQQIREFSKMNVWYQMVTIQKGMTNIIFNNPNDEILHIWKDQEVAHLELMTPVPEDHIDEYSDEVTKCIRHIFQIPQQKNESQLTQQLFPNDDKDIEELDFQKLNCPNDIPQLKQRLIDFCKSIPNVFAKSPYDIGCTNDSEEIDLSVVTNATPQNQKPIPTNPKLYDRAMIMLSELFDRGLISHSPPNNSWSASMFFLLKSPPDTQLNDQNDKNDPNGVAAKKDLEMREANYGVRAIADYRGLNLRLKRNKITVTPLPSCRSIIDQLSHMKIVSLIDLRQCFWHAKIKPSKAHLTGFNVFGMHLISNRLPHGMLFSAAAWQRIVRRLITKAGLDGNCNRPIEKRNGIWPFVDNIILASDCPIEHEMIIKRLLNALNSGNLKVNFQKSFFGLTGKFCLFGWEIDLKTASIKADPEKLAQITKMQPPRTTRQARKFTGLFTHYNQAIPKIAAILSPIYQLCSDKTPFKWTDECQIAFQKALDVLGKAECLILPSFQKPFFFSCDAAKGQAGSYSVWQQNDKTHLLQPIKHGSIAFKNAAKFYSQFKCEIFTMITGLQASILYFQFGSNFCITDVGAIQWLVKYRFAAQQIHTWSIFLCSLNLQIIAVRNTSAIIRFNDAFCRPHQLKSQMRTMEKYNDKNPPPFQTMDFSGMMAFPIKNLYEMIEKFQAWMDKTQNNQLKDEWSQFAKNQGGLINRIPLTIHLRDYQLYREQDSIDWQLIGVNNRIKYVGLNENEAYTDIIDILTNHFPNMALTNLIHYQENDQFCARMAKNLKPPFHFINKVLFKQIDGRFLLIWPKQINLELIKVYHEYSKVYHLRGRKLLQTLRQSFYIQNYRESFKKIMQQCKFCQLHTKPIKPRLLPDGLTIELSCPLQMFNIDFVIINSSFTKLPAVLTVTCPYSNYTIFIPSNDKMTDTEIINQLMTSVFSQTGFPVAIGCDRQSSLISTRIHVWARLMGIRLFKASAPTANSAAERQNRICIFLFSIMNHQFALKENLMGVFCTIATLTYNSTINLATGRTPHFLVFNGGPRLPNIGKLVPKTGQILEENFGEFAARYAFMIEVFHQLTQRTLRKNAEKEKKLAEFDTKIQKGDLVLLQRKSHGPTRQGHKLRAKMYETPFRITKVLQKSYMVTPFLPNKLNKPKFKRQGKDFKPVQMIVSKIRCKKIIDPLPFLNLGITRINFDKAAQMLAESPIKGVKRVKLYSPEPPSKPENTVQAFLKAFIQPNIYLSNDQTEHLKINLCNFQMIKNSVNKEANPFKIPYNKIMIAFTKEHIVSLKSRI